MSTTTNTTTELPEPIGWDGEGVALFPLDELDRRYDDLLDRLHRDGGVPFAIDNGVGELLADGLDHADEYLEVVADLVARERLRQRAIGHISTEEGKRRHREALFADLRSADWYPEHAARFGWPDDPADMDPEQLDTASVVRVAMHRIEQGWEGDDWFDQLARQLVGDLTAPVGAIWHHDGAHGHHEAPRPMWPGRSRV